MSLGKGLAGRAGGPSLLAEGLVRLFQGMIECGLIASAFRKPALDLGQLAFQCGELCRRGFYAGRGASGEGRQQYR